MIDKRAIYDDLIDLFIQYQQRIDCPMPTSEETLENIINKYRNDYIFNHKVKNLAAGVMQAIDKHLDK